VLPHVDPCDGSVYKIWEYYAPKPLRISSLLITHKASQSATDNHSHQSSFYCLYRAVCTRVLHGFHGSCLSHPFMHTISILTLSPQKLSVPQKVSTFDIYNDAKLRYRKPLCWLVSIRTFTVVKSQLVCKTLLLLSLSSSNYHA